MKIPSKSKLITFGLGLLGGLLLFLSGPPGGSAAPPPLFTDHRAIIAIDPGHGGHDAGVHGPTGHLEKNVCLDLAQKLSLQLEPEYQVVLTRSDDYHVDLLQRTAAANQAKADLFISLHTGSSFLHSAQGMTVYYHQSVAPQTARTSGREAENDVYQPWRQIQARHSAASQTLADVLKKQIDQISQPSSPCRIQSGPLTVLEGADMPAVIVEIGHLTHPAMEKALSSPKRLELIAAAIKKGIVQFLEQTTHSP